MAKTSLKKSTRIKAENRILQQKLVAEIAAGKRAAPVAPTPKPKAKRKVKKKKKEGGGSFRKLVRDRNKLFQSVFE
jgi:hypothetical protein